MSSEIDPEPHSDVRIGMGGVEQPRPTAGTEAATVIGRDLAAHLERLDGPPRTHGERAAWLLSAIRTMAANDMQRLAANAVADCTADASAGTHSL
jgi:hypothetical protein